LLMLKIKKILLGEKNVAAGSGVARPRPQSDFQPKIFYARR